MATPSASLHTLYSDHHGWLHGWLRRKLGCTHQAADLAQDTFLRILDKQRELSQLREPRAYLTTIAQGLVVNHWRRRAIEQAYCEALAAMPQPLAQSPEQRHTALQALEEISRLLDQLPARTQQIFCCRSWTA